LTSAYLYASEGGRKPHELQTAYFIERYGIAAIYGRPLFAGEIYRMNAAKNVFDAYIGRKQSDNWAEWSQKNPRAAELLGRVEALLDGDE